MQLQPGTRYQHHRGHQLTTDNCRGCVKSNKQDQGNGYRQEETQQSRLQLKRFRKLACHQSAYGWESGTVDDKQQRQRGSRPDGLWRLQYPIERFEVIIVDDGGEADLGAVIGPLRDRIDVRLVTQRNSGPAQARNNGAAQARGEFLAFTDDDCLPTETWLAMLVHHLQQDPSRLYGGKTVNALKHNLYSTASQALIDYLYGYYNADPKRASFFTSNNIAMSRAMFGAVGGFEASFPGACGEDREFSDRWLYLGYKMSYVPDATILHNHELTFRTFCKQHFNYGAGAVRYRQCRARRGQPPLKFEPLSFYLRLVGHPWQSELDRRLSLSALMVISQLANALGFAWERLFGR